MSTGHDFSKRRCTSQSSFLQTLQQALLQNQQTFLTTLLDQNAKQLTNLETKIEEKLAQNRKGVEGALWKRFRKGLATGLILLGVAVTVANFVVHHWHF